MTSEDKHYAAPELETTSLGDNYFCRSDHAERDRSVSRSQESLMRNFIAVWTMCFLWLPGRARENEVSRTLAVF